MPAAVGAPSVAIQMRPLLSKAQLSGQDSQPFSAGRAVIARAGIDAGLAADQEDRPGALGRRVVAVLGRDLDDVAVGVAGPRIGAVDLLLGAPRVVGQQT